MAVLMRYDSRRSQVKDFNIMRFEYPADREELDSLIGDWNRDPQKEALLTNQLQLDYAFMSFLFPAILVLCVWAGRQLHARFNRNKYKNIRRLLLFLGWAQILAWSFDFCENTRLLHWLQQGKLTSIFLFKEMVLLKFVIGILGFLVATGVLVFLFFSKSKVKQ